MTKMLFLTVEMKCTVARTKENVLTECLKVSFNILTMARNISIEIQEYKCISRKENVAFSITIIIEFSFLLLNDYIKLLFHSKS